jgi:hypothetical protein
MTINGHSKDLTIVRMACSKLRRRPRVHKWHQPLTAVETRCALVLSTSKDSRSESMDMAEYIKS